MDEAADDKLRLFFAIWPDAAARAHAAVHAQAVSGRCVVPENMHITLLFLGDVEVQRLPALEQAVAAAGLPACSTRLDRLEITRRGIAWLSMTRVPASLVLLYRGLVDACAGIGFEPETRPFRPHLTLARRARPRRPQPIQPFGWRVDELSLVQSQQNADGPCYRILRQWPLTAEA